MTRTELLADRSTGSKRSYSLNKEDLTGRVFTYWTLRSRSADGLNRWECVCKCGTRKTIQANVLIKKKSQSCGCLHAESASARKIAANLAKVSRHGLPIGRCGNAYEIRVDHAAIILDLTGGATVEALIDLADTQHVLDVPFKWTAAYDKRHNTWYCQTRQQNKEGTLGLHRFVMDAPKGAEVDHLNHDGLDNRRSTNLKITTTSGNQLNRKGATSRSSTGILGVTFNKAHGKFRAFIRVHKEQYYLGFFDSKEDARDVLIAFRRERGIECQL